MSCDEQPPLGTMLQIHVLPDIGGDTLFANMYAAYDALSDPLKGMLAGLTALHESEHIYRGRYSDRGMEDQGKVYPKATHPVIRTHPETGRKAVFVNRTFATAHQRVDRRGKRRGARAPVRSLPNGSTFRSGSAGNATTSPSGTTAASCTTRVWDYWPHGAKGTTRLRSKVIGP